MFMGRARVYALVGLAALAPLHSFAATDQTNAQAEAERLHRKASDTSMQNSSTSAMTALMNLAALNISGAVSNGYKAYGQYRNSEGLDDTADIDAYLRKKMASSGASLGATSSSEAGAKDKGFAGLTITNTSFSRLDPSYLRTGKAGELAAEFEAKSGMSREEFLSHLAKSTDNKISPNDPQLVDKVISRFEGFVAKIPNQEFRANIEKGIKMIPETARTGLVAQAVQKFASIVADTSTVPELDLSETKKATVAEVTKPIPVAEKAVVVAEVSEPKREPSSINNSFLGIEKTPIDGKDPFGNIIQAAMDARDSADTIFQQVTRRYRAVTPLLVSNVKSTLR